MTLFTLALVTLLALGLRLVLPHQFPWGMHEDELTSAGAALKSYCWDYPYVTLPNNLQAGLYAATIGPVHPWLGPWWAARAYFVAATVMAVPLSWGVARALGLSSIAALAGAAIPYAVFPWALAYGRTGIGGEVILNQLIVLFALLKLLSARGAQRLGAVAILWFGLMLCLYGYTAGKVLLLTAIGASLMIPGYTWTTTALILTAAGAATLFYHRFSFGHFAWYGFDRSMLPADPGTLASLSANWRGTLAFLWEPVRETFTSQSISGAHPLPIPFLVLAALGVLLQCRRRTTLVLLLAFCVGLLPALLGPNGVSTRRLLTAGALVPFSIAMAVDAVAVRWRGAAAVLIAVAALAWGPARYFSVSSWSVVDIFGFCAAECSLRPGVGPASIPKTCKDLDVPGTSP
jgi:hypothetical protein